MKGERPKATEMNPNYLEEWHRRFHVSGEIRSIFERIVKMPTEKRKDILKDAQTLVQRAGLAYALLALYRQQVQNGFVLADPLSPEGKKEKIFHDAETGVRFRLQWNPDREIRNDYELLIQRGVVAESVDETRLVHKDANGRACYLCESNIRAQNPREILLGIDLAGERYYVGANFAYITDNHFTIMSARHRPQGYRKKILKALNDCLDQTGGLFRAIFNGLAGASIVRHEHLQVTTEEFPIEGIRSEGKDVVFESRGIKVSRPKYYIPVWLIEGTDRATIEDATDEIIRDWHSLDRQNHTENIISSKFEERYRTFVVLRDKRKLAGSGKKGDMGAFEAGGNVVLSYEAGGKDSGETNEKHMFDNASLEMIRSLLREIAPEEQRSSDLTRMITFHVTGSRR